MFHSFFHFQHRRTDIVEEQAAVQAVQVVLGQRISGAAHSRQVLNNHL